MTALEQAILARNARLIIVEDDRGHAAAIQRALADAGWTRVDTVVGLAAFRQRAAEQPPDLVLADLILADGEGLQLLASPAEEQPYPIVIMTSHGDERRAVEALKAGAFDYIVKTPAAFIEMPNTLARIQREWALVQERQRAVSERVSLQRQLAQAQKMESIGRLAGGIAHDFNNILGSILGYTELALALSEPDKNRKLFGYLSNVQRAGERARDLVANMLAVTRLKTGDVQAIDVGYVVREVTEFLRPIVPSTIRIDLRPNAGLPTVAVDSTRLHQALTNLCVNARDAVNEHGTIEVTLDWWSESSAVCTSCGVPVTGRWLALSVRDNGAGIPPGVMEKMFDPFFTTKSAGHGTGLGLSMVHAVAHEAGGHVLVNTAPGQGTTVKLLFPSSTTTELVPVEPAVTVVKGSGQRILVVDDEVTLAELLGETLSAYGYEPKVFSDSSAALKYFNQDPSRVDALITDYTMPLLTGGDLAREILNIRPGLPIIMCTGYTDKMDVASASQLGVARYLQKPVRVAQLLKTLNELVPTPCMNWVNG